LNPRYTIAEIAAKLKVDREDARGFVKFLVAKDLAELRGERSGRGAPEKLYALEEHFEETLAEMIARAGF